MTPTFTHGLNSFISLNAVNLSGWTDGFDFNQKADIADTSTMGTTAHTFLPGLKDGDISGTGLFDGQAAAIDITLFGILGTVQAFEVRANSAARSVTNPGYTGSMIITDYKIGAKIGAAVVVSYTARISGAIARQTS
jgi:hypothetical protein